MMLSEAWEKYKSDKRIEGYSHLTLKMYGFQYNLLKCYLGDIKMCDITTENLKQYLVKEGRHLKPSSEKLRHDFYSKYF